MRPSVPFAILGVAALAVFGGYEVMKLDSATLPTQDQIEMKTYTNTKYDYSFRYPSTWHIDTALFEAYKKNVSSEATLEDVLMLTTMTEKEVKQTIQEWNEYDGAGSGLEDIVLKKDVIVVQPTSKTINTINEALTGQIVEKDIVVTNSGFSLDRFHGNISNTIQPGLEIGLASYIGDEMYRGEKVSNIEFLMERRDGGTQVASFDAMLKTFSFAYVDEINTAKDLPLELLTYSNTKYGYSFQYPSTWHIDERLEEAYYSGSAYDPDNLVILTNLAEPEVTQELKALAEHQGIASGWENVAVGRMILISPVTGTFQVPVSNEISISALEPDSFTTSGLKYHRTRYYSDYEIPADRHNAYLPYPGNETVNGEKYTFIHFSIDRPVSDANLQAFEELLKTVTYQ